MEKTLILLMLLVCIISSTCFAQEAGDIRVNVGAIYGSDVNEGGLNLGGEYLITDQIGLSPNFSYYFVDSGSFIALNIDGRYYFVNAPQIYGLLGLAIERAEVGNAIISISDSAIGFNIGAGAIFSITGNLGIHLQVKLATPGQAQGVALAGLVFSF